MVEIYPRLFMGDLKKSNQAERSGFLDRYPDMAPEHRNCAEKSDDAFDAVVSALELVSTWEATPRLLANTKLEGQIWC